MNLEKKYSSLAIMTMRNYGRKIRLDGYKIIKEVGLTESKYISIIEKANMINRT